MTQSGNKQHINSTKGHLPVFALLRAIAPGGLLKRSWPGAPLQVAAPYLLRAARPIRANGKDLRIEPCAFVVSSSVSPCMTMTGTQKRETDTT